jgi:C_GCAxxG_C_C family probable redox protein
MAIPTNADTRAAECAMEATGAGAEAAIERARELFLDDRGLRGCAETAFIVLKEAFGLPDAEDSSAAMALNGGIAYSGGTCGAITGAALAVGMRAERRFADHRAAKRAARLVTADLLTAFEAGFGTSACRELIRADLHTDAGHQAFMDSGIWRDRCMRQIEMAVARLTPLADEAAWDAALASLEAPQRSGEGPTPPRS